MAKTTPQTRAAQALTQALAAVLDVEQSPRTSEAIVTLCSYIRAAAEREGVARLHMDRLTALAAIAINTDGGQREPRFMLVNNRGFFAGAVVHAEDAAALVSILGNGATVRCDADSVLWTEGAEVASAGESYDGAADIIRSRMSKT